MLTGVNVLNIGDECIGIDCPSLSTTLKKYYSKIFII